MSWKWEGEKEEARKEALEGGRRQNGEEKGGKGEGALHVRGGGGGDSGGKKGERRGREREKAATFFGPFFFVQSEGGPFPDPKTSRERGLDSRVNETSPKKVELQEKQERRAEEVLVFAHEAQATLSQCMDGPLRDQARDSFFFGSSLSSHGNE